MFNYQINSFINIYKIKYILLYIFNLAVLLNLSQVDVAAQPRPLQTRAAQPSLASDQTQVQQLGQRFNQIRAALLQHLARQQNGIRVLNQWVIDPRQIALVIAQLSSAQRLLEEAATIVVTERRDTHFAALARDLTAIERTLTQLNRTYDNRYHTMRNRLAGGTAGGGVAGCLAVVGGVLEAPLVVGAAAAVALLGAAGEVVSRVVPDHVVRSVPGAFNLNVLRSRVVERVPLPQAVRPEVETAANPETARPEAPTARNTRHERRLQESRYQQAIDRARTRYRNQMLARLLQDWSPDDRTAMVLPNAASRSLEDILRLPPEPTTDRGGTNPETPQPTAPTPETPAQRYARYLAGLNEVDRMIEQLVRSPQSNPRDLATVTFMAEMLLLQGQATPEQQTTMAVLLRRFNAVLAALGVAVLNAPQLPLGALTIWADRQLERLVAEAAQAHPWPAVRASLAANGFPEGFSQNTLSCLAFDWVPGQTPSPRPNETPIETPTTAPTAPLATMPQQPTLGEACRSVFAQHVAGLLQPEWTSPRQLALLPDTAPPRFAVRDANQALALPSLYPLSSVRRLFHPARYLVALRDRLFSETQRFGSVMRPQAAPPEALASSIRQEANAEWAITGEAPVVVVTPVASGLSEASAGQPDANAVPTPIPTPTPTPTPVVAEAPPSPTETPTQPSGGALTPRLPPLPLVPLQEAYAQLGRLFQTVSDAERADSPDQYTARDPMHLMLSILAQESRPPLPQAEWNRASSRWATIVDDVRRLHTPPATTDAERMRILLQARNAVMAALGRDNYARDTASILDGLLGLGTNCQGNTALILGAVMAAGLQPPSGYRFTFGQFSDHVESSLYAAQGHRYVSFIEGRERAIGPGAERPVPVVFHRSSFVYSFLTGSSRSVRLPSAVMVNNFDRLQVYHSPDLSLARRAAAGLAALGSLLRGGLFSMRQNGGFSLSAGDAYGGGGEIPTSAQIGAVPETLQVAPPSSAAQVRQDQSSGRGGSGHSGASGVGGASGSGAIPFIPERQRGEGWPATPRDACLDVWGDPGMRGMIPSSTPIFEALDACEVVFNRLMPAYMQNGYREEVVVSRRAGWTMSPRELLLRAVSGRLFRALVDTPSALSDVDPYHIDRLAMGTGAVMLLPTSPFVRSRESDRAQVLEPAAYSTLLGQDIASPLPPTGVLQNVTPFVYDLLTLPPRTLSPLGLFRGGVSAPDANNSGSRTFLAITPEENRQLGLPPYPTQYSGYYDSPVSAFAMPLIRIVPQGCAEVNNALECSETYECLRSQVGSIRHSGGFSLACESGRSYPPRTLDTSERRSRMQTASRFLAACHPIAAFGPEDYWGISTYFESNGAWGGSGRSPLETLVNARDACVAGVNRYVRFLTTWPVCVGRLAPAVGAIPWFSEAEFRQYLSLSRPNTSTGTGTGTGIGTQTAAIPIEEQFCGAPQQNRHDVMERHRDEALLQVGRRTRALSTKTLRDLQRPTQHSPNPHPWLAPYESPVVETAVQRFFREISAQFQGDRPERSHSGETFPRIEPNRAAQEAAYNNLFNALFDESVYAPALEWLSRPQGWFDPVPEVVRPALRSLHQVFAGRSLCNEIAFHHGRLLGGLQSRHRSIWPYLEPRLRALGVDVINEFAITRACFTNPRLQRLSERMRSLQTALLRQPDLVTRLTLAAPSDPAPWAHLLTTARFDLSSITAFLRDKEADERRTNMLDFERSPFQLTDSQAVNHRAEQLAQLQQQLDGFHFYLPDTSPSGDRLLTPRYRLPQGAPRSNAPETTTPQNTPSPNATMRTTVEFDIPTTPTNAEVVRVAPTPPTPTQTPVTIAQANPAPVPPVPRVVVDRIVVSPRSLMAAVVEIDRLDRDRNNRRHSVGEGRYLDAIGLGHSAYRDATLDATMATTPPVAGWATVRSGEAAPAHRVPPRDRFRRWFRGYVAEGGYLSRSSGRLVMELLYGDPLFREVLAIDVARHWSVQRDPATNGVPSSAYATYPIGNNQRTEDEIRDTIRTRALRYCQDAGFSADVCGPTSGPIDLNTQFPWLLPAIRLQR